MPTDYKDIGKSRGGGDPNILRLKESQKIRPLDHVVAGWKQHGIEHPSDPEQFTSVVCPGPRSCPLCRKPVSEDGSQRFPISRRYAVSVWDYGTSTVKVLLAGPQIFDKFKEAAEVGMDPTSCDWTIIKSGTGRSTEYKTIKHDSSDFTAAQITPDLLHSVDKYEAPSSTEAIFEVLEKFGIDYDALTIPQYTYEQALEFKIPFGQHRGLTVEQLVDQAADYAQWLHSTRLESGQLGDPIFVALQAVLEERGLAAQLDDALAMLPEPSAQPAPQVSASPEPEVVGPPAQTIPDTLPPMPPEGFTRLVGPIGVVADFPDTAVESLLGVGFTMWEPPAEPEPEPDKLTVLIGGQKVELPYEQAQGLILAGTAQALDAEPEPLKLPLPDETVQVDVSGTVVPMKYVEAIPVVDNPASNASFADPAIQAAHLAANAQGQAAAVASPTTTPTPGTGSTSERTHDPEKPFECEQCEAAYKTQGALTQHKNREHKAATPEPSAIPAASNGSGGVEERLKDKISRAPFARDFDMLLKIFEEETGKKNFAQMSPEEMSKLEKRIDAELAKA